MKDARSSDNDNHGPGTHPLLDRWLDGTLNELERETFERAMDSDPALAEEVRRQTQIDEALRRRFRSPEVIATPVVHAQPHVHNGVWPGAPSGIAHESDPGADNRRIVSGPKRESWGRRAWMTAAAALMLIAGVWMVLQAVSSRSIPQRHYAPIVQRDVIDVYEQAVAMQFVPDWLCETEKDFESMFRERFGRGLGFVNGSGLFPAPDDAPDHTGTRALGVSYAWVMSPRTLCLLFNVNGTPVMVFIDQAESESIPDPPPDSGLRLFRRVLGDFVLLELSPLDDSATLDLFEVRS